MFNAKAKTDLRSNATIWDSNFYYFRDYCPSHNTSSKVQIQDFNNKDFYCIKEFKAKDLKPALLRTNIVELSKQNKKNKKDKK